MEAAITTLVQALPALITGPAAGIVVAMLCLAAFGYFLTKYLLPQQERQLDRVLNESKENRKVFADAVEKMGTRLDKIEDDVSEVKIILNNRKP